MAEIVSLDAWIIGLGVYLEVFRVVAERYEFLARSEGHR